MKAKLFLFTAALALATAFSGCNNPVINVTLPQAAENQSHIYTLFVNTRLNQPSIVAGSLRAYVTIEGQEHAMAPSPYGDEIYQYDYTMPGDREQAKYFYTIRYDELVNQLVKHRDLESQLYTLNIVNRYVLQMENTRGPVGAVVPVVGNGFAPADTVVIGGSPAPTTVASANAMTFAVPPLPPGDYPVEWHAGTDVFQIGAFHVDISALAVTPASLELASGDATSLTIAMGEPAPAGGVTLKVLTDAPGSVVMPVEVRIPGGQKSVTVKVAGGAPGAGTLHINAPGFSQAVVPIKVNEAPVLPVVTPTPVEAAPAPVTPVPVETAPAPVAAPPATTAPKDVPAAAVIGS
jgi:hypothetical protein